MPEMSRRGFLASCVGVATASAAVSLPLVNWSDVLLAATDRPLKDGTGILVLITLYGGNDGLNTVIPFTDNRYQDARPDLAYRAEDVLKLDDQHGLNPGMPGMAQLFHQDSLAIIRGVGYPEPDRSHFRSMDIWQSASLDSSTSSGWIGRWLDSEGEDALGALHFGRVVPPLAVGDKTVGALFSRSASPYRGAADLTAKLSEIDPDDSAAMRMVCDSYKAVDRVNRQLEPLYAEDGTPDEGASSDNALAAQLTAIANCINSEVPTRVYSAELGGFDTHADERDAQEELLRQFDEAVSGFVKRISGTKHGKNVVIMAYSEFGRRVAANASDGTDHGTAGPVFVLGDRVRGGFHGEDPSLKSLIDDDLKVTTDFRDVYHDVLLNGLRSDPEPILGAKRKEIGFLRA